MNFRPRSSVLSEIKKTRRKELIAAFTRESNVTELTLLEFLSIACLYQLNMRYILVYMELITKHGAIIVTVCYFLLTGILGMPLFMLFTFMSSYSKRSYITFWKCVPLFEGLGYGLAILRMATELDNITMASFSLLLLIQFSAGDMGRDSKTCVNNVTYCSRMFPTENVTIRCDDPSVKVITSVENYIESIRHKYSNIAGISFMNLHWFIITGISWIIILLSSIYGLGYVKRVTVRLQLICGGLMLFICVVCVSYISWSTITTVELTEWTNAKSIFRFNFWFDVILHSAEVNILANMIWLGTLKPKKLHPKYAAITVTIFKLAAYILFVCFAASLVKESIVHYKILDSRCLKVDPRDVIFTLVPDILLRTNVSNLFVPVWYLCTFFCGACPTLYTIIGMADSVLQKYTSIGKYRVYLILALCIAGFFGSIYCLTKRGNEMELDWNVCVMPFWSASILLLVSLAIFFIYSTRALIEDYLFVYGYPPERYWIASWKGTPILALFCFILVVYSQYTNSKCTSDPITLTVTHLVPIFGLSPIILLFITTCFKHVGDGTLNNLAKPAPDWGPYEEKMKIEKAQFFPQRDIRYRKTQVKCRHNCIKDTNQDQFLQLVVLHRRGLKMLENKLLLDDLDT